MKKTMRKMIAMFLTLACVPVTGLTASAFDAPNWWGQTTWSDFEGETPINDHGMITLGDGALYEGKWQNEAVLVQPRNNVLRFILREDVEFEAVEMQVVEIVDTYFPGLLRNYDPEIHAAGITVEEKRQPLVALYRYDSESGAVGFELNIRGSDIDLATEELETSILRDLARQHLISAFYGWGSTGFYSHACFDENILSYSGNTHTVVTKNRAGWYQLGEEVDTDWEGVQAYLDVHYPQYDVKSYENEYQADYPCYRISGTEDLSLRECLELAGELYEHFGITVNYAIPESAAEPTLAHNALERAGDVTLDCELDIMDVIAANKYILGVDTLCDTAKKNADVSCDGTPDASDALAIMKEVVGVTTDFAES